MILRPEHVCLSDPPVIIDCLEFSRAFRLVDPFDELTFLTLECELLDGGWVGEHIMKRCAGSARRQSCSDLSSSSTGLIGPVSVPALRLRICSSQTHARPKSGFRSRVAIFNWPNRARVMPALRAVP